MDFGLSSEQRMMQETVRALLTKDFPPASVVESLDEPGAHDPELWTALTEVGLPGLFIPEAHGGSGFGLLDAALLAEVGGEGVLSGPLLGHQLASFAIMSAGSTDQQEDWLPQLASGENIGTVAWAEPGDSWEPDGWTVTLQDGRLSGRKVHVPCAEVADLMVVGVAGGDMALVDPSQGGVEITAFDGVDRTRRLATVDFEGAAATPLPPGVAAAPRVRDLGLVLLAADSFGCASRLLHETIDYLSEREQFGTRLTQFQGIKHELANLAAGLEPARALYWYAGYALDEQADDAPRAAAIAKSHISDRAMEIARACVDLHGAIGYTWEATTHLWYKRIIFNRAFLGGSDHHRSRAADLADW